MEFIALILIVYFFIGAGICLLICVDPNGKGVMGKLHRFTFKKVPKIFSKFIGRIFGERALQFLGNVKHYLTKTNHPIVQIFYLLISVGGFIAYEIKGIFKFMPNKEISDFHVVAANTLAMICFWTYFKCCSTQPGKLTKTNEKDLTAKYIEYYDGVLYLKNNKCQTCQLVKPARSKHCSICGMCVSRFDHHCIWIRQCVGQKNYKYFVSFLFLHGIWCLYLSIIGAISLLEYLQASRFWELNLRYENQIIHPTPLIAMQFMFMTQTIFVFLIVMCLIMGVTLLIFVSYHFFLIASGCTTNERVKRSDLQSYYKKEVKYLEELQKSLIEANGKLPEQFDISGKTFKSKQFCQHKEDCLEKFAILQKNPSKKGFINNLRIVFKS